jgi:hypothetical protein
MNVQKVAHEHRERRIAKRLALFTTPSTYDSSLWSNHIKAIARSPASIRRPPLWRMAACRHQCGANLALQHLRGGRQLLQQMPEVQQLVHGSAQDRLIQRGSQQAAHLG